MIWGRGRGGVFDIGEEEGKGFMIWGKGLLIWGRGKDL